MTSDKWDQNSTDQMSQMGNGCQTVRTAILKNMCLFLENFSKRLKITGCSVPRCRHSLDPPGTDPPAAAQPSPHPVEGQQPRPVAFTKVVAPIDEVPLLRLALELPEVNVEIQTQKHVKTIGFAKSLRLKLLAGDEPMKS